MKKLNYLLLALLVGAFVLAVVPGCTKDPEWPESNSTSGDESGNSSSSGTSTTPEEDESNAPGSTDDPTGDAASEEDGSESGLPVIKLVWNGSSVSVSGDEGGIVSTSGAHVTVNYSGTQEYLWNLSGSSSNGSFKLYSSEKKQTLSLAGLRLTNPSGAAINIQSKKKITVLLGGEDNTLEDGETYTDSGDENLKATFFSEGQLIFKGSGSLSVVSKGRNGIHSDDFIRITGAGPSITVTSTSGHGIVGKDSLVVKSGTVKVSTSADSKKAMRSDGPVRISGGSVDLTVSGGVAYDSEESEYKGSAGLKAGGDFTMLGGSLTVSATGQGGKGISGDAAGYFRGGEVSVKASGSNYGSSSSGGPGFGGGGGWGGGGGGGRPHTSASSDDYVPAKGIKFDGSLVFCGSHVSAVSSSSEGIESKGNITISDGVVSSVSSDDAMNSSGDFTISGGLVYAHASGNDGLDANGNFYIKGGVVFAVGSGSPELGIDANTEGGKKLYVTGGTIIAIGGLENGSSLSQPVVTSSSWAKNSNYALYDGDTALMAFKTPASGGGSMVLSCSGLKAGSKYTLKQGVSVSGGTTWFGSDTGAYYSGASVSGGTGSNSLTASTSSGR